MNVSRLHRILPRRTRGRVLVGGLLLAALVTGPVAAAPAAFAARSSAVARSAQTTSGLVVSWSESPASSTAPDTRTVFSYTNIKPGSTISDYVAVLNRSKQSVAFEIYATDATGTTPGNVLELLPSNAKPRDIGSWVTFAKGATRLSIVIGAEQGIIEPFTIAVPRLASPGDHTGGMIAQVGFPRKTSRGSVVVEYQRIAVPIELRVAGPLQAGLRVESISTGFHSPLNPFANGSATVSYTVQNIGNVRLTGTQVVSVTGPFGISSKLGPKNLPTLLPGDSIRFTAQLGGLYPLGSMTAHIGVSGNAPPGAPQLAAPVRYATGSASLFAVPWSLFGFIILVIGAGYGAWRTLRWRRGRLRAKLAAAADTARRETERRLLGGKDAAGRRQKQS